MSVLKPSKPQRNRLEVPVHNQNTEVVRRTFSANFSSKKQKPRDKNEIESDSLNLKLSRRHLSKENRKLLRQNEEITMKFNELEELSLRKIVKLKEKISNLQAINEEITNENGLFKAQSDDLLKTAEELRLQLEISKHCRNCEDLRKSLEKINEENSLLKNSKKELEEDLDMLKTVVFRLNQQMERYQEKLRKSEEDNEDPKFLSEFHKDHTHTPLSWGKVNTHTLGPLLDAYQDTIAEKEEIIQNYQIELLNFTGKLKEILKENEDLHQSLTEDEQCSTKLKVEIEDLAKDLKDVKEQNDILIKKCAIKHDKLDEVLKFCEVKVERMKRDYSVLQEQYCKSMTEAAALKEKNRALTDSQDEFKNEKQNYIPMSVHNISVNECKKWYEELKLQYQEERSKLNENIEHQKKVIEDLQNKIIHLAKDKEQMEQEIKKRESKCLELEHALSEVQFSKSACRKQLHKAMSFAKDLVGEQETLLKALNQRKTENKAVQKMGSDIATRMDSLRCQLKGVQRGAWEELNTVEKRIQEQDQVILAMKQEHTEEILRLQRIIKDQEGNNVLLQDQSSPSSHYLLYRERHKNL